MKAQSEKMVIKTGAGAGKGDIMVKRHRPPWSSADTGDDPNLAASYFLEVQNARGRAGGGDTLGSSRVQAEKGFCTTNWISP